MRTCVAYWLYKNIIFAIDQLWFGILVKRFDVVFRWIRRDKIVSLCLFGRWTGMTLRLDAFKTVIGARDSLVALTLTCSRGRNFGECEWFVLIIIEVGFVIARLLLCMRWRWTSSSACGSVQKWSEVFIRVNSNAHGPTDEKKSWNEGDEQWVYLVMKPG